MYNVVLNQKLESIYGTMNPGDIIESIMIDDLNEAKRYVFDKYIIDGIKVKLVEIK